MKKKIFVFLIMVLCMTAIPTAVLAADKTYKSNTKLDSNIGVDHCVIEEGVTLNLNGRGLEIHNTLTVKKGGKITGGGIIIFDRTASCDGLTLYYQLNNKYRKLPCSIKELASHFGSKIRPQFMYVKEIDGYCYTGDSQKPTNWSGNPFDEDMNKDKAEEILCDLQVEDFSASLYDINKVSLSWTPQKPENNVLLIYKLYYRNVTKDGKYQLLATIEDCYQQTYLADKLSKKIAYEFKLVPVIEYYNKTYEGNLSDATAASAITLGAPKISKVSGVDGKPKYAKVTWGKLKGDGESGYEVMVSRDEKAENVVKVVDVPNKTAKSKQIKLNYGTFYFCVRTYIIVDDEKVYTDWSKPVKYEIKKNN